MILISPLILYWFFVAASTIVRNVVLAVQKILKAASLIAGEPQPIIWGNKINQKKSEIIKRLKYLFVLKKNMH